MLLQVHFLWQREVPWSPQALSSVAPVGWGWGHRLSRVLTAVALHLPFLRRSCRGFSAEHPPSSSPVSVSAELNSHRLCSSTDLFRVLIVSGFLVLEPNEPLDGATAHLSCVSPVQRPEHRAIDRTSQQIGRVLLLLAGTSETWTQNDFSQRHRGTSFEGLRKRPWASL